MVSPGAIAFSIFGIDIMWYGILIAMGMLLACVIGYVRATSLDIRQDDLLDLLLISIPVAIIGARVYYILFRWDYYAGDFARIINIREGGLAIHGGLLFAFLAVFFVCKYKNISALNTLDLAAPCIALAQSIGRWGNFFNEEAHGIETSLPWAVIIDGTSYHPTFLYESLWCIILFFVLSFVTRYRKFTGQIFLLYVMLYSLERFFVESLRTDSLMIGPFRQAMVLSATAFGIGLVVYIVFLIKRAKNGDDIEI